MNSSYLNLAAEIHFSVKKKILYFIETISNETISLRNLRDFIEKEIIKEVDNLYNTNPDLSGKKKYNNGLAFPIGLSVDDVVAHYTPVSLPKSIESRVHKKFNENSTINFFSLIKIDYGISIEGNIIDSAFTVNLNNSDLSSILIKASREVTLAVCKSMGIDQRLNHLADLANEIINSYENPVNNKPLKLVDNVYSHNILPSQIHGGKFIRPDYKNYSDDWKIEDGEQYAIEFYPTSGSGTALLTSVTQLYSHYKVRDTSKKIPLFEASMINKISNLINNNLNTLPFCPNFIDLHSSPMNHTKTIKTLQQLHSLNYLDSYPPIIEYDPKALVSQTEATVIINENERVKIICGV